MNAQHAIAEGFTVDRSVYPWVAYRGPRFAPTEAVEIETPAFDPVARYCLCDDPDYCLRNSDPEYRRRAIGYRRRHDAALPKGAK